MERVNSPPGLWCPALIVDRLKSLVGRWTRRSPMFSQLTIHCRRPVIGEVRQVKGDRGLAK
jgi:hypothetical protein